MRMVSKFTLPRIGTFAYKASSDCFGILHVHGADALRLRDDPGDGYCILVFRSKGVQYCMYRDNSSGHAR